MSSLYHTPIPFGSPATSGVINTALGSLDNTLYGLITGSTPLSKLRVAASTTLTIASGSITATQSYHKVDTESAAASDDLDTIAGGAEGGYLTIELANASHAVVLKNGSGNIVLSSGEDLTLDAANKVVMLFYNGTNWVDVSGSGGGGVAATKILVSRTQLSVPTATLSIDLSSVVSDYYIYRVFFEFRSSRSASSDGLKMTINADASTLYSYAGKQLLSSISTSTGSGAAFFIIAVEIGAANAVANHYSFGYVDIYNPRATRYKQVKAAVTAVIDTTYSAATATEILMGGLYEDTDDINTIEFFCTNGDLIAGSVYSVIGINELS